MSVDRRTLLKTAGVAAVAGGIAKPALAQTTVTWRM